MAINLVFIYCSDRGGKVWYNRAMKKETIKETGKLLLDITKIVVAVAIVTPLVKEGDTNIAPFLFSAISASAGLYLIDKGVKDE
jgi:hypothetical protein